MSKLLPFFIMPRIETVAAFSGTLQLLHRQHMDKKGFFAKKIKNLFFSLLAFALGLSVVSGSQNRGAELYRTNCSGCHGENGMGIPGLVPPLAGDPVVTAKDPARHIRTVLFGKQGTTINGTRYVIYMPSWAGELSDAQIASIINYERSSWGNHAQRVTPRDVARIRAEGPGR